MSEHNLTPDQLQIPKEIRAIAYRRFPMTCDAVHNILEDALREIMDEFEIPPEEVARLDAIISRAFCRIRDEVTQPFRTEQMKLVAANYKHG
jgi:hypothetical protein